MTFDEVGVPARLSGGPSPATNIPVVHTLLMAIQSSFDLEPEEPRKRHEKNGRVTAIILVQKGPVVQALEQFSHMHSERQQTLVLRSGRCQSFYCPPENNVPPDKIP